MTQLKSLVAAAVALPLSALAQYAPSGGSSVQIYGRLDASVNAVHIDDVGTRKTVATDTSLIGFRGSEDLGGGLTAFFKLESQLDVGTGSPNAAQFWNREAMVGLNHPQFGQVDLGTHWVPTIWLTVRSDPFGRAQMGGLFTLLQGVGARGTSVQFINSVQYATPRVDGFIGRVVVQAPEGALNKNYAGLVEYFGDRLYAGTTYESVQTNTAAAALGVAPTTRSATLGLGVTYRFDAVKLFGYAQTNKISGLQNVAGYNLGVTVPVGLGEFRVSAAHTNNPGKEASLYAVGYAYFLSKRTQVYTSAARLNNSAGSRFAIWPASQDGAVPSAPGQDSSGIQVGMRHTF